MTQKDTEKLSETIKESLYTIVNNPDISFSSRSIDYINASKKEYDEIVQLGEKILPILLKEFDFPAIKGLDGLIIIYICNDILKNSPDKDIQNYYISPDNISTAEDWFNNIGYKLYENYIGEYKGDVFNDF